MLSDRSAAGMVGGWEDLTVSAEHEQLLSAWLDAGLDLGIGVEVLGDVVCVRQFGSAAGMLCGLLEPREGQRQLQLGAEARGAAWSCLSRSYLRYDRQAFVAMLNDWGWCAGGDAPDWYTGKPWTE